MVTRTELEKILGDESHLLDYRCRGISADRLHLPGPDYLDRVTAASDRRPAVLRNLALLYGSGRLAGTGYLSILPVDQGIEHSAGASFAPNPDYFDPGNIVKLALEAGCSGVASSVGVLGAVARKYAHKIPFIVKLNHNELLTAPNQHDQVMFASVQQSFEMGAVAVGATIYFGSEASTRQIQEVSEAFQIAHDLGMFAILWCYTRNPLFNTDEGDMHTAADLTGQANHLGVTIQADIIKQKLPTANRGYAAVAAKLGAAYGRTDERMYSELAPDHPIEWTRYQLANCYMGRVPLISSGGASGANDFQEAVMTAVINKGAGGSGLIMGRKAFQRPLAEGVKLLGAVQDVYLSKSVTIA